MDGSQFDVFSRSLSAAPSRRHALLLLAGSALAGLLGPVDAPETAAHDARKKCKKLNGDRKKKCLKKAKKHNAQHTTSTVPPSPPSFCPPVCPACQSCNTAVGQCLAQQNGQPGQDCQAPKVCCTGACCDPIHACNASGACATCADFCPQNCSLCVNLVDGRTVCADFANCDTPVVNCDANTPCSGSKVCATSLIIRGQTSLNGPCTGVPVGTGACVTAIACA